MASQTSYLELILPGFGEYVNSWWEPLNDNFTAIDTWAQTFGQEVIEARFSKTSLKTFLEVAHNVDGTLKSTPEVLSASSSPVYGFQTTEPADFTLGQRVDEGDREVWRAREGQATLRDLNAFRTYPFKSTVLEGTADANGYPTWMGMTANKVQVDGSADPLWLAIDGKLSRVRTLKELTLTGAAGTKYVYAQFQAAGVEVVDGDSSTPPPALPVGTTSLDVNDNAIYFNDATKDFTTEDVQPGDTLNLLDTDDAGEYYVKEVAPDAEVTRLTIIGLFPVGGLSSINYNIYDPLAITLGFDTTETPAAGKVYLGEADFDGVAVTAVRARHFRDTFIGEWRAVDVSGGSPTFEEIYSHKLGSTKLDIGIQVSQANDDSQPVEELDLCTITSTLGVSLNNTLGVSVTNGTLAYVAAIFNPGTTDATYTPGYLTGSVSGSLTGSLSASLTGSVVTDRGVAVKWDKNRVWVKNAISAKFYKDYGGTTRQTGFIRVVVRKRG